MKGSACTVMCALAQTQKTMKSQPRKHDEANNHHLKTCGCFSCAEYSELDWKLYQAVDQSYSSLPVNYNVTVIEVSTGCQKHYLLYLYI